MADRLATLFGTESTVLVSKELLVAQDVIRSIGKSVDTLLMEIDQQAFEAYMSSSPEGSVDGRKQRTPKTGSPTLSPVLAAISNPAKSSSEDTKGHGCDFLQVVGGPSPPVKRNRNAERRQCRRERPQQAIAADTPSSPLDLSHVSYDKCMASVWSRLGPVQTDEESDPEHIWTYVHMN